MPWLQSARDRQKHTPHLCENRTGAGCDTKGDDVRDRATIPAGPWLDIDDVVTRLRRQCRGNQSEWAAKHEISAAYVSDVLNGRRLPGDKITRALGLEKALLWRTPSK